MHYTARPKIGGTYERQLFKDLARQVTVWHRATGRCCSRSVGRCYGCSVGSLYNGGMEANPYSSPTAQPRKRRLRPVPRSARLVFVSVFFAIVGIFARTLWN